MKRRISLLFGKCIHTMSIPTFYDYKRNIFLTLLNTVLLEFNIKYCNFLQGDQR